MRRTKNWIFKIFGTTNLNGEKLRDIKKSNKSLRTKIFNEKKLKDLKLSNKHLGTKNLNRKKIKRPWPIKQKFKD